MTAALGTMAAIEWQRASSSPPGARPAADPDLPLGDLLLCLLPRGRANAITIEALARLAHATHRDTEEALQLLADSGFWPVVASSQRQMGVWYGTRADVREYLDRHDARIRTMLRRRHGLRRWLSTPEPRPVPLTLWEEGAS